MWEIHKSRGYNLEHNFGHGQNHLAAVPTGTAELA
jgi:hypothetical protein